MEFLKIISPKTNFPYPTREYNTAEKKWCFSLFSKKFSQQLLQGSNPEVCRELCHFILSKYICSSMPENGWSAVFSIQTGNK